MSYANGPRIVTDGLVCCLDAANRKSYAGSGSAWNDLSGNNNHATLVASPTYDTNNKGSISFNGSTQYAEVTTRNTNLEFQPTSPYSCFVFLKSPASASQSAIISNLEGATPYQGWDFFFNNGSAANTLAVHFKSSWTTNAFKVMINYNFTTYANQWTMLAYTYDGSCPTNSTNSINSVNFYINGQLETSGKTWQVGDGFNSTNETISYDSNQRFRVASRWLSGQINVGSPISVGNVLLYNNKELSADEVKQNYDALKGRFGYNEE